MIFEYLFSAVVLGFIVAIPPGSVTIVAGQRALRFGFGNSIFFSLGSCLADAFYILLVYLGVAHVIADNRVYRIALWFFCGIVLVVLAVTTFFSLKRKKEESRIMNLQKNRLATFISGILITLTNPVTIVGWIALAGNFFLVWNQKFPEFKTVGPLSIVFINAGVLLWFLPLTYLIHRVKKRISEKMEHVFVVITGVLLFLFSGVAWYSAIAELFQ